MLVSWYFRSKQAFAGNYSNMNSFLNCSIVSDEEVNCNGTIFMIPETRLGYNDKMFWIYLGIYAALVLAAGLMSGLTMGLLSLDIMTLKVMKDGGTPTEKRHATKILPIVKRHHLLLVTLLLGNAAAVESMPIFLDKVSDPVTAILVSVTAVLIFGEVVPMSICTRYGLAIGATMAPLVYVMMAVFFVVAWPISKLLDCLLGKDHSTFYRRGQLKVLVDLHGESSEHMGHDDQLSRDEVMIIKGALDMKNKTVQDAMVPIECVYMLDINRKMDTDTMNEVISQSHSRVPVYEGSTENITSLLLVKTLIKLDPQDATPIRTLVQNRIARPILHTNAENPLFDMLNEFQEGKGHLAVVHKYLGHEVSLDVPRRSSVLDDNPHTPLLGGQDRDDEDLLDIRPKIIGIITMEDVLEELIQEEIVDETDVYVDIKRHIQVARAKAARRSPVPRRHKSHIINRSMSHPPLSLNRGSMSAPHVPSNPSSQHGPSSTTSPPVGTNTAVPDLIVITDTDQNSEALLGNQVLA